MLKGRDFVTALQELLSETENLRSMWAWALEDQDVELLEILSRIWLFYEVSGRYRELSQAQDSAIAIPESAPGPRAEVTLACALARRAAIRMRVGDLIESEANLLRSNQILVRHAEFAEVGLNLNLLAMKAHAMGDQGEERRILEESIQMCRRGDEHWALAYSLNDLGMVACLQGDLNEAERLMRESLDIFVATGDARGQGFALNNVGIVNGQRHEYQEAMRLHKESLRIRRSLNNQWGAAQSLIQLGIVARLMGAERDSADYLTEALRIAHELRAVPLLLDALVELAEILRIRDNHQVTLMILSGIAQHPSSSPAVTARVQRLREGLSERSEADPQALNLVTNLDEIVALLFGEGAGMSGHHADSR